MAKQQPKDIKVVSKKKKKKYYKFKGGHSLYIIIINIWVPVIQ